jgi:hypothetical protein
MPEVNLTTGQKLNVFISYSRDDLDFADQLDEALQVTGFATTIDRHGISGGEDWRARLAGLIRDADTVVFVLSPASAKSDICAWEVDEAVRLNKRVIPVLCRSLDGQSAPAALAQLNYFFFYREPRLPGSGFGHGLRELVAALNTDLDWLREHTRLLQRATEWEAGGHPANRLLSGGDIAAAKAWAAQRPKDAPEPTELHLAFLRASEDEETERASTERRRLAEIAAAQDERQNAIEEREAAFTREAEAQKARARARHIIAWGSAAAVALVVLGVSGFAVQQQRNSARQVLLTTEAVHQKAEADKQATLAEAKTKEAEANFREAQKTESYFRAEQAKQAGADAVTAALLALEGLPDLMSTDDARRTRPFVNEAWDALYGARLKQRERAVLSGHTGWVTSAVFAPDGGRILTASWDSTARLWDRDGKPLATLQGHTFGVTSAVFAPDGGRILTASADDTARLWEAFPDPQALVDRVKAEVPRCLTPEQRERLFLAPQPPRWCIDMHKWPYDGATPAQP